LAFGLDGLGDRKSELQGLENQLDDVRGDVRRLSTQERDLKSEIEYLEEEEHILESQISLLRDRERELRFSIRSVESGLTATDRTLNGSLERIRSAMCLLYKGVFRGCATPSPDRDRNERVTRCILTYDGILMEKALSAKSSLVSTHSVKTRDLGDLEALKSQILSKEQELARTQERKQHLLAEVRSDKKEAEEEENFLVQAIQKLEEIIRELEARFRDKGVAPAVLAGKTLASPVEGKVVSSFGTLWHEKYNTRTKNNGVDVKALPGSDVRTVESGEVVHCSPFMTYGDLIIIEHDGFFSIYGQLEETRVAVGQKVNRGSVVGRLSGNGSDASPVLHFELRVGGEPVNPLQYVQF
jgi:septal ring factor EnvC (AmiA/AmiB activator)